MRSVSRLKALQAQAEQLKAAKLRWYDRYISEEISKAEYLKMKAEADQKLADHEAAVRREQECMDALGKTCPGSNDGLDELCRKSESSDALTAELANAFIKAIYVYDVDRIEIEWRFKDVIQAHSLES